MVTSNAVVVVVVVVTVVVVVVVVINDAIRSRKKFHSSKKPELKVQKEKVSTERESRTRSYKQTKLFLSHKTAIIAIKFILW